MRLTINPGPFQAALNVATTAVKRSSTLPVLEHALLEADGETLTVSGTDLESRAWHTVACTVIEPGAVALPPKALANFLDNIIPTEPVTLTVGDTHKAELVSGVTRIRTAGFDAEEFPVRPDFSAPAFDYTLSAVDLSMLIRSTAFAAAPNDSRPALAGVLFRARDGVLQCVAADGYRLAMREIAAEGLPELDVIAQAKMLSKLAGHLDKATSARLVVDANRSMLLVDTEQGCWTVRVIDGQFPDFNRIVPRDTPIAVTVAKADLMRASKLIRNVVTEVDDDKGRRYTTSRARLSIRGDAIDMRATGTGGDQEADTTIEAVRERGDNLEIAFNGAYFRDAVEVIDAERITLEMTGPASPSVLHAAGPRNGHLQVVLPMSIAR